MKKDTLFSKIISKKIPANIVYQDELVTAFEDISPQAPVHILIVTNEIIPTVNDIKMKHEKMLGRLFIVASKIAFEKGINKEGYRLIVNCNAYGNQDIYHLHMHLLGGKPLGPMLFNEIK